MNHPDVKPTPDDERLEAMAIAWLCERDEGFTPARAWAFATWCKADPRHSVVVARVERSLAILEELPSVRAPLQARYGRPAENAIPLAQPRRMFASHWIAGLAAALVLVAALGWQLRTRLDVVEQVVLAADAPRRVELTDGSVVNLNAGSMLEIHFGRTARRVTLTKGEVHFSVAHDTARPFIVSAEGVSVRAVGTAFNVRVGAAAVEVLVVEGRVELARNAGLADPARLESSTVNAVGAGPTPLTAGEHASVARHDAALAPVVVRADPSLVRETLAWHTRVMSFSDVALSEVLAQFNLRNPTQLVVADAELGARKMGGSFALDNVDAFVRLLEQDGDVVAERRGPDEIVLRRVR